jgi:hypothetical protein
MQAAIAALAAESERRIAQADAAMKAAGAPIPPNEKPTAITEDDYFRAAWSAAMTDVADEMQAKMANLPPAQTPHRRPTHQRDCQRPNQPRTAWSMIILGGTPPGCESCDQIVQGLKTSAVR